MQKNGQVREINRVGKMLSYGQCKHKLKVTLQVCSNSILCLFLNLHLLIHQQTTLTTLGTI